MPYQFPPDVDQLVRRQMASGKYPTEDDLLREALSTLNDFESDVDAVRQALDDWDAGDDGLPLDEAFALIRTRHQIAAEE